MSSITTDSFFRNGGTASAVSNSKPGTMPGTRSDAVEEFLKEAKKSPIERLREAYLKAHNLSEEALAALPPAERAAIEDDIRKAIQEAMTKRQPGQNQQAKSFAETLAEVG